MSVKLVAGVNFRNKKQRAKGAMGVCFQNNGAGAMGTFLGLWDPQVARMPHEDIVPVTSERHSICRTDVCKTYACCLGFGMKGDPNIGITPASMEVCTRCNTSFNRLTVSIPSDCQKDI